MVRGALIVAVFAVLAAAAPGQAQHDWRQTTVEIADLDLSTGAGERELDRRIGRAVSRICGSDRECRAGAWASTEQQAWAAIERDRWMRRMAAEHQAELRACGWVGCRAAQAPAYYPAPPPPPPPMPYGGGATVIVITTGYPPPQVTVYR